MLEFNYGLKDGGSITDLSNVVMFKVSFFPTDDKGRYIQIIPTHALLHNVTTLSFRNMEAAHYWALAMYIEYVCEAR